MQKARKVPFQNRVSIDEKCNAPAQTIGIRLSVGHQCALAGIPTATINRGLFPAACGSKNLVVSSS